MCEYAQNSLIECECRTTTKSCDEQMSSSCMMRRSMIFSFQFFSWQFVWSTHGTFGSNEKLDILLNWPNTKALFGCICKLRSVQFSLLTLSNEQCTLIECYSIIFQQLAFSTNQPRASVQYVLNDWPFSCTKLCNKRNKSLPNDKSGKSDRGNSG